MSKYKSTQNNLSFADLWYDADGDGVYANVLLNINEYVPVNQIDSAVLAKSVTSGALKAAIGAGWITVEADYSGATTVPEVGTETLFDMDATAGAKTVLLPAAATVTGKIYIIKKTDATANTVTVDGAASETIDGSLTKVLDKRYDFIHVVSNGTNWDMIDFGTATEEALLDSISYDSTNKIITSDKNWSLVPSVRPTTAYAYSALIDASDKMTGGAATKTYVLGLTATKPLGSGATGDSNDSLIKGAYSNYAVNDTNFIVRGINTSVANRSGGVLGRLEGGNIGAQAKSGGTVASVYGATITAENYGTVTDLVAGIDVAMKNESTIATDEFGVRVSNLNNSLATKVKAAFRVANSGANTGFVTGLDLNGSTLTNQIVLSNGTTVTVSGDTIVFTLGSKSYTITMV